MNGFVCWLEGAGVVALFIVAGLLCFAAVAAFVALLDKLPEPSTLRGEKLVNVTMTTFLCACFVALLGFGLKVAHDNVCARGFRGAISTAVHSMFDTEKRK